jgi:N-acetylmuramoyl-L-alanine amidase
VTAGAGLRVVVDVQHLYRDGRHQNDRGTVYHLTGGGAVAEADCARHYADALVVALRAMGAIAWTNDPAGARLVGPYERRQKTANELGANLYLAAHLNAGGGGYALTEFLSASPFRARAMLYGRAIVTELERAFPEAVRSGTVRDLSLVDRGAVCIRAFTGGPAIILEPLFGDHPRHQWLLTLASLEALGQAIARGVAEAWRMMPAARSLTVENAR